LDFRFWIREEEVGKHGASEYRGEEEAVNQFWILDFGF
jgi:hypothetical protein